MGLSLLSKPGCLFFYRHTFKSTQYRNILLKVDSRVWIHKVEHIWLISQKVLNFSCRKFYFLYGNSFGSCAYCTIFDLFFDFIHLKKSYFTGHNFNLSRFMLELLAFGFCFGNFYYWILLYVCHSNNVYFFDVNLDSWNLS